TASCCAVSSRMIAPACSTMSSLPWSRASVIVAAAGRISYSGSPLFSSSSPTRIGSSTSAAMSASGSFVTVTVVPCPHHVRRRGGRADVAEPARAGPGSCGLPREQVGVLGVLGDVLVDVPAGGQHGVARATGLVEGELHDLARDALAAELRE